METHLMFLLLIFLHHAVVAAATLMAGVLKNWRVWRGILRQKPYCV
jgi:hypothetical protein